MKIEKLDEKFLDENMMGPNSLLIIEELMENIKLQKGARVLDLGCGRGLTSAFLAAELDVCVYAADLWISATDNYRRFKALGLDNRIIPIHADAHALPFAEEYFDAVVSVDAYHYFGNNDEYFETHLRPLLKKDAIVALAFPGMKHEVLGNLPEEMKPLWDPDALEMWHSIPWWRARLEKSLEGIVARELHCFDAAWDDWLKTENPYAIEDRQMMQTDSGRFMNLIAITGRAK